MPKYYIEYGSVEWIKRNDPKTYEFFVELAKISTAKQTTDNYVEQYDTAMIKIFELIDDKYRIDLTKGEIGKERKIAQLTNLAREYKNALIGKYKSDKTGKIDYEEQVVKYFIRMRDYGKGQARIPLVDSKEMDNGAYDAVRNFCLILDLDGIGAELQPQLYKKRCIGQIMDAEFHDTITKFEAKARKDEEKINTIRK